VCEMIYDDTLNKHVILKESSTEESKLVDGVIA